VWALDVPRLNVPPENDPMMLLLALAMSGLSSVPQDAVRLDDVRVVSARSDVEFCQPVGGVDASSGWNSEDRLTTILREHAAKLGANAILITSINHGFLLRGWASAFVCSNDSAASKQAADKAAADQANKAILCDSGADCEFRWSRVTLWLQDHCTWKFRSITEMLISTEGPMDTERPAFEATKMPNGDGKTYRISLRVLCGAPPTNADSACSDLGKTKLRADFTDFVTKRGSQ